MAGQIVECVPNFSEGRDAAKVEAIAEAIIQAGGHVLRSEMDPDHNRSVITFAGRPDAVVAAAVRAVETAARLIDLSQHRGVHPRIGATDVVPFVPLAGISMEECAALAHRVGAVVWGKLGIPVYFYEASALIAGRARLENIRKGQFERAVMAPDIAPDVGGPALHPTAGAVVLGARKLLVAFNVNLNTANLDLAQTIARNIRASNGGFPTLKAMGVMLASRNLAQVSMNFTDFERTPLGPVFETIREEANRHGVAIASSQLVGLIPRQALEEAGGARALHIEHFSDALILENALAAIDW